MNNNFTIKIFYYLMDISQLSSSGSNGAFKPLLVDVEFIGTISKFPTITGVRGLLCAEKKPSLGGVVHC